MKPLLDARLGPLDESVEIVPPDPQRYWGDIGRTVLHEIARKLPEYHELIDCTAEGRDVRTGAVIPVNVVGRWLFGVPGYERNYRMSLSPSMSHRVGNPKDHKSIFLHYPSRSPEVVHRLVRAIKQAVEKEEVQPTRNAGTEPAEAMPTDIPVPEPVYLSGSPAERSLPMGKVFVSYRRGDSIGLAGRIYDRLAAQYGRDAVFMDVDAIPFGVDFRQYLSEAVSRCDVLLAVIGEDWLTISRAGKRRLDDPKDFVRIEVEAALQRGIPVIPVLIEPARMPQEDELPETLQDLAYRNAANIDPGRDFHSHVDRLIRGVDYLLRVEPRGKGPADLKEFERSVVQLRDDAEEALLRIAQVAARGGRVNDQDPTERVAKLTESGEVPKELAEQLTNFLEASRKALTGGDFSQTEREGLVINGASLVPALRRHCKIVEMEREFQAHGLWHMRTLRPQEAQKYFSWSAVAASAHEFDYDYDIYREAAEQHNKRLIERVGVESAERGRIDVLELREYVQVLQFRESEIQRVLAAYEEGQDAFSEAKSAWQWPKEWGDVGWNSQVVHGWLRDVERELTRTRKALQLYRQRLGTVA